MTGHATGVPERRNTDRAARYRFDPHAHATTLVPLLRALASLCQTAPPGPLPAAAIHRVQRRFPRKGKGFFSRSELIAGFRAFSSEAGFSLSEAAFVERMRMRPVRTQSGVTPITVLSRPHPCPGKCVFCPNDARMPKSYLSDEPGCQRAEQHGFDPYLQTFSRLSALRAIGHSTAKVELIVLGGTWSFYPEAYQVWFVTRCFDAMNDFGAGHDRTAEAAATRFEPGDLPRVAPDASSQGYNRLVERALRVRFGRGLHGEAERREWTVLRAAHRDNEGGACRCVGLVLETRPDHLDAGEARRLRALGCTKVQLGFQSLDDQVLRHNKRGHDVAATRSAVRCLRAFGFKIHAHWMPNLLGSDPARDVEDFDRMFGDPDLCPDELKVYPCSLVESAELMHHYRDGSWRPYDEAELLAVLTHAIAHTPRYCRLSRVIRDICSGDIVVGNRKSNFREVAERTLDARQVRRCDIRSREVGLRAVEPGSLALITTPYPAAGGEERFIEFVTADDKVAGFCRLSLPGGAAPLAELRGAAIVRELHVYGAALSLGERQSGRAQHGGLGTRLLAEAVRQATAAGFASLAVISAVGTKGYYRRQGFVDGELYQHRALGAAGDLVSPGGRSDVVP